MFFIFVYESHDVSKKEQKRVFLHYVDNNGYINEYFIGIDHVNHLHLNSFFKETHVSLFFLYCWWCGKCCWRILQMFRIFSREKFRFYRWGFGDGEISSDRGFNEATNIQHIGDTLWGSRNNSLIILIFMFYAISDVLEMISILMIKVETFNLLKSILFIWFYIQYTTCLRDSDWIVDVIAKVRSGIVNAIDLT